MIHNQVLGIDTIERALWLDREQLQRDQLFDACDRNQARARNLDEFGTIDNLALDPAVRSEQIDRPCADASRTVAKRPSPT